MGIWEGKVRWKEKGGSDRLWFQDGVGECEIKVAIATQFQMHAMSVLLTGEGKSDMGRSVEQELNEYMEALKEVEQVQFIATLEF